MIFDKFQLIKNIFKRMSYYIKKIKIKKLVHRMDTICINLTSITKNNWYFFIV